MSLLGGVWRFGIGLSKKVLLANNLGGLADIVFGVRDISQFSVLYTWLGAVAYTLQIYYDFSGYSDMAIGIGRMFGFHFLENFDHPYTARSVREFWRRWHISLYKFFRDYVYIPLGGSHCTKVKWIFNTLFVWFLTGLWHGPSWKYIFWGLAYGIILLAERHFVKIDDSHLGSLFGHIYTMLAVILLWVVFRAENLPQAFSHIRNMFGIGTSSLIGQDFLFQFGNFALLLIVGIVFSTNIPLIVQRYFRGKVWFECIQAILLLICVTVSISYIYIWEVIILSCILCFREG